MNIESYVYQFFTHFPVQENLLPWEITRQLSAFIYDRILVLNDDFTIKDGIALHKNAIVESNVVIKAPAIVGNGCFIGSNAYLRGGCFLISKVSLGPGCEIKTSLLFQETSIAHFNFIGDSIIGQNVNFEAGAVTANHFNESADKTIHVFIGTELINTGTDKFGALIGDHSKIGANAVLSPGTVLQPHSVVKRLELVEQVFPGR
jgi:NDP-sugar pyrophosphorylase family protein